MNSFLFFRSPKLRKNKNCSDIFKTEPTHNRIITRLNRIKKIVRNRHVSIDTEKYLILQEFWCISWPPQNSSPISTILNLNFAKVSRNFHEILQFNLEVNLIEQISILTQRLKWFLILKQRKIFWTRTKIGHFCDEQSFLFCRGV